MKNIFSIDTKHLADMNISYFSHMMRAFHIMFLSIVSSLALFIHAIFPFIFTKTSQKINLYLYDKYFKEVIDD